MIIMMLLCCFGFDGVVAAVVSIAGGSGLVEVLMVGDREGVVKIDGCLLLWSACFLRDLFEQVVIS